MKKTTNPATAESMGRMQREISVSEFFLKNRHLLGFDNPRKALLTAVKEAVDNSLDACDEAGILPEISVDIRQTGEKRFLVVVTDNGPGILRSQIPKIFAKLLYGSKFHRLRMSRGQQGIGISAAGMYGQLTTGGATVIQSRVKNAARAHHMEVQLDTRANKPVIIKDVEIDWAPLFPSAAAESAAPAAPATYQHGTQVAIEMEAAYIRGKLSVDEYLKQCAIVNSHLALHFRLQLLENGRNSAGPDTAPDAAPNIPPAAAEGNWTSYQRATRTLPVPPREIKPHPQGVELGMLTQMLKDTSARTLKSALETDFSRISSRAAVEICRQAGMEPKVRPAQVVAQRGSEALFKAINTVKLMRPPTDCLSPIGEQQIVAGLRKEIQADFYTAVTRNPEVYRGNPFQVEAGLAYARPSAEDALGADDPVRLLRFANKVPLLYMAGACAVSKAAAAMNWKNYGLTQPRGSLPLGPALILVHIASVWVPFTSESKEAIAHYPEIIREITFALQECGRRLSVFLSRRRREAEQERKRNYIEMYLPHLALGLRQILEFDERRESDLTGRLRRMLERTRLKK